MKRKLSLIFSATLLLFLLLLLASCKGDGSESGKEGGSDLSGAAGAFTPDTSIIPEGIVYTENLAFTPVQDGKAYSVTGFAYGEAGTELNIPATYEGKPVVSVSAGAFRGAASLERIYVPYSVTVIGEGAFSGCSSLCHIVLPFVGGYYEETGSPASTATLFGYIFGEEPYEGGVETKQFYNDSRRDHTATFYIPASLTHVAISHGEVEVGAFSNCTGLLNVTLAKNVTLIENGAFYNCRSLTELSLSSTVERVGNYAFSGCKALLAFSAPMGLRSVGHGAFTDCSALTTVSFPASVYHLDNDLFIGCSSLASLTTPAISKAMGYIFGKVNYTGSTPILQGSYNYYVPSSLSALTVVGMSVPAGAFQGFSMLKAVSFSAEICEISENSFNGCSGVETVYYYPSYMDDIPSSTTYKAPFQNISNKEKGFTLIIGATVKRIPQYLFHNSNVTEICFEENSLCREIAANAFKDCEMLNTANFPSSLRKIGEDAFYYCKSFKTIHIESIAAWFKISLSDCGYVTKTFVLDGNAITDLTVPASVGTIPAYSLGWWNVTSVTLSSGILQIDDYGFYDCDAKSVYLPSSLVSIGIDAFTNASAQEVFFANPIVWVKTYVGYENSETVVTTDAAANAANLKYNTMKCRWTPKS